MLRAQQKEWVTSEDDADADADENEGRKVVVEKSSWSTLTSGGRSLFPELLRKAVSPFWRRIVSPTVRPERDANSQQNRNGGGGMEELVVGGVRWHAGLKHHPWAPRMVKDDYPAVVPS